MKPNYRHKLILLPPNRVWRTYPGGKTLDQLAQIAPPADSHFAEDWIASTTRAVNPPGAGIWPRAPQPDLAPGISPVRLGNEPGVHDFAELLASDPEYFLGAAHVQKFGAQPQLLVKFLDSGTRLHFQVHPTREFAQRILGAPSGKTEAYYVLGTRNDELERYQSPAAPRQTPEPTGCIYVGFQRPPTRRQLREYIVTQDIAAIEACFDRINVKPGDTFIIPGGTPHALGAGVFMVEIQEPSDLVIRFEFERAGIVLPESARFMNRDVDFALELFNLAPVNALELETRIRCQPRPLRDLGAGSHQDELIGPAQTDCFRVRRTHLAAPLTKTEASSVIAIVVSGSVIAEAGGESHRFERYEKFFLPAQIGQVTLSPVGGPAQVLECFPPG
jgi:mannose-6-phosphate isomerase